VLTDLRAARTVGLRLELADHPHIALRTVAHSLAAHLIGQETGALAVSAREIYIPAIAQSPCADELTLYARRAITILWHNAHLQGITEGRGYTVKIDDLKKNNYCIAIYPLIFLDKNS
jgi:hypothetical protein